MRRVRQLFGRPFIEGRDKILLLGEAVKFDVTFQKCALKLFKISKIIEKLQKKAKFSRDLSCFCSHSLRTNRNFYILAIILGSVGGAP